MSENTSLTVKDQALAAMSFDYGDDAGSGFENQTADDLILPFIRVLQSNSPQVEDGDCSSGDLFNTVTEVAVDGDEGIEFIPLKTERVFVEWVPRNQGGGFVAQHDANSAIVAKAKAESESFGKYKTDEGNDLVETYYVYAVVVTEDGPMPAIIDFTSTKIKAYRKWNMRLQSVLVGGKRPPLFANRARLTTWKDKNSKGTFYNVTLTAAVENDIKASLVDPGSELFEMIKATREIIVAGEAKIAYDSVSSDAGSSNSSSAATDLGEEAPF